MDIGGSQKNMDAWMRGMLQRLPRAVDIFVVSACQRGDGGTANLRRNSLNRIKVALRGDGETGFQNIHAQAVKLTCHLQLILHTHAAAGRLLAVAERRVKYEYLFRHEMA